EYCDKVHDGDYSVTGDRALPFFTEVIFNSTVSKYVYESHDYSGVVGKERSDTSRQDAPADVGPADGDEMEDLEFDDPAAAVLDMITGMKAATRTWPKQASP
ncbi:hypothetical protein BGZ73_001871, partial [Actinomortierella ambigua]